MTCLEYFERFRKGSNSLPYFSERVVGQQPWARAFQIAFKDTLNRCDPDSFCVLNWKWKKQDMDAIGAVLTRRKEKVDRKKIKFETLQPMTIHFDGSVEKRAVPQGREYSMELFFAKPGDLVVAKIDLKNGAVGIVPDDWENIVVTGHFAVYQIDKSQIRPSWLHRII
jgi:type I restriction enzyme S subunit